MLPDYVNRCAELLHTDANQFSKTLQERLAHVQEDPGKLLPYLWQGTSWSVDAITHLLNRTIFHAVHLFLIPVYYLLFMWNYPRMAAWAQQYVPASK